ncbi:hypothetical protein DFQ30_001650, partial [Apophysomyces sp. BC1015]
MRYLSFVSLAVVSVALHVDDMLGSIGSFRPNSLHRAQRVKELMEKFIEETGLSQVLTDIRRRAIE